MSTAKKVIVKFRKGWRGYNAGESAGFDEDVAETLVSGEVAEYTDSKARAKPKPEKREKPEKQGQGAAEAGAPADGAAQDAGSAAPADPGDDERP